MKVKELIKYLSDCDGEANVILVKSDPLFPLAENHIYRSLNILTFQNGHKDAFLIEEPVHVTRSDLTPRTDEDVETTKGVKEA